MLVLSARKSAAGGIDEATPSKLIEAGCGTLDDARGEVCVERISMRLFIPLGSVVAPTSVGVAMPKLLRRSLTWDRGKETAAFQNARR